MEDERRLADVAIDEFDPRNSAITMGYSIACDGYVPGKTVSIFTHFHSDHTKGFTRTLANCDRVIMTGQTLNAIKSLLNSNLNRANIEPLEYGRRFYTGLGETVELFNANHVPGSSQVLVTLEDKNRILYSGDFCYPGIQVPKCDTLVLAAERGTPLYDYYTDKPSILRTIFDKVRSEVSEGHHVEIRAHTGSMQDIMAQLEGDGTDGTPESVEFFATKKHACLTEALASSYGVRFRKIREASVTDMAKLRREGKPYVSFAPVGTNVRGEEDAAAVIQADANREFAKRGPFFTHDGRRWMACLSAHSSFSNILEYVRRADPDDVVVDGSRAGMETASSLASSVVAQLGKRAVARGACFR